MLPDQKAEIMARCLVIEVVTHFGVQRELKSDQGRDFKGRVILELCKRLHIMETCRTPYQPQSDDQVECFNRRLQNALVKFVNKHQNDCAEHLHFIMMVYSSTVYSSMKCMPKMLMLCREVYITLTLCLSLHRMYRIGMHLHFHTWKP